LLHPLGLRGEMGSIAEMTSYANHGHIHADPSALDRDGDHIGIDLATRVD